MTPIGREEMRRLVDHENAQVVEVLPAKQYESAHLPGAVSMPLEKMTRERVEELRRDDPVIVYCFDLQ